MSLPTETTIPPGCYILEGDGEVLWDHNGELFYQCDFWAQANVVIVSPLPPAVEEGEALTVRVFVADTIGDAVADASVTLHIEGVGTMAGTTGPDGYVVFGITILAATRVWAVSEGVSSAVQGIDILIRPVSYGGRRKRKPAQPAVSYHDIGALPAAPAPASRPVPTSMPRMQQSSPVLAQAVTALAQDQMQKAQQEAAEFQKRLS